MRFEFQIVDGPSTGRRFQLEAKDTLTVGRTNRADQAISSDLVMSSVHFKLQADDAICHLQDLGSTNGTFVNGQPVKQKILSDGDMITAGNTTFELRITRSPASSDRPPVPSPQAGGQKSGTVFAPPPTQDEPSHDQGHPPEIPTAMAHIEMDGPIGVRSISIGPGKAYVFGRTQQADFVIPDEMISATHFSLRCEDATVSLQDLGSSNGTFVHDERVQQATLRAGDGFLAGATRFRIVEIQRAQADREADATTAPPKLSPSDHDDITITTSAMSPTLPEPVAPPTMPPPSKIPAAATSFDREPDGLCPPTVAADRSDAIPQPWDSGAPDEIRTTNAIQSKWPYQTGLTDSEDQVRRAALLAAVWTAQPWVMEQCRAAASPPNLRQLAELRLFAILGDERELSFFQGIVDAVQMGGARFRILGTYGHPEFIPQLLEAMDAAHVEDAYYAGEAFRKITGRTITSERTATVTDRSGQRDVKLPDPIMARDYWQQLENTLGTALRVSQGCVLMPAPQPLQLDQLDMETRLEVELRRVFTGEIPASPALLFRVADYFNTW